MTDTEAQYVRQHVPHNMRVYLFGILLLSLASSFADVYTLIPNLALRLHAPAWLATLTAIGPFTIAYLPVLLLGWLLKPETSRRLIYRTAIFLVQIPLVLLVIGLCVQLPPTWMIALLAVSMTLYAFAQGLTILPCWDLYARIFPADRRGAMLGRMQAVMQGGSILSAIGAGWLISAHGPLAFPYNYALGIGLFIVSCLCFGVSLTYMREYLPPPAATPRAPFGQYLRDTFGILRTDHAFRATLIAALLGATVVAGVSSLLLAYAEQFRGFSTVNDAPWLIACAPLITVPVALVGGRLADRIGVHPVIAGLSLLCALGVAALLLPLPGFSGKWLLLPLIVSRLGLNIYQYTVITVMNHAPAGGNARYMTVYYVLALLPGLLPLLLARQLAQHPIPVLGIVAALLLATGVAFLLTGRSPDAPSVTTTAEAAV